MKRALLLLLLTTLCVSGSVQMQHSAVVAKKRGGGGGPPPGPDVWYYSVASGSTDSDSGVAHEGGAGGPLGARITPAASGTCTKVSVFIHYDNSAGTLKVALFDTSGNLLGSGTTALSGGFVEVNAFYEVTLGSPVAVTNGTPYIVGYMVSGAAAAQGRYVTAASGTGVTEFTTVYASFPTNPGPWLDYTLQHCVGMYVD